MKIERAAQDVSLDPILQAFAAAGSRIAVKLVRRAGATRAGRKPGQARGKKVPTALRSVGAEVQIELTEA